MKVLECELSGILLLEPDVYVDNRGFFLEGFENSRYMQFGIAEQFVQDSYSRSFKNVVRGLHFTKNTPQSQMVTVVRGEIFDVVVDLRKNSPTFGNWAGVVLSESGLRQIYMPHGFAHGFCVLSDYADLHYKASHRYNPSDDAGLIWNDDEVGISWPVSNPILSERDLKHPKLGALYAL